jgi:hypothetical protein
VEAEQAGSNVGTILGLAIGAVMALTEVKTEEQAIQDEQDFNEFLTELEAEEEEHTWQQAM